MANITTLFSKWKRIFNLFPLFCEGKRMTVSSPDDVLRESLNMQDMPGSPDDFALAKALQEQERALLMLQGGLQGNAGWQENIFAFEPGSSAQRSVPCQRQQQAPPGEAAAGPATEAGLRADSEDLTCSSSGSGSDDCSINAEAEGGPAAAGGPWEAADGDEDLRMALDLHQAEHRALQQRMLELAGVAFDDADLDLEDDSADPDEMTYEELQALGEAVGVVSKGACQAALSSLQTGTYPCCGSSANSGEQCAICQMDYEQGDSISLWPCRHLYHSDCAMQWLRVNKVCPICNAELVPEARKSEL